MDRFTNQTTTKINYIFRTPMADDKPFNNVTNGVPVLPTPNKLALVVNEPNIIDQGGLGSSVSCAMTQYISIMTKNKLLLSRVFHYYCGRLIGLYDNRNDTGIDIYSACKVVSSIGICPEFMYTSDSPYNEIPPPEVFQKETLSVPGCVLVKNFVLEFISQTGKQAEVIENIKLHINMYGLPVFVGIMVYNNFYPDGEGRIPIPNSSNALQGGTCMLIIGYDDTTRHVKCCNSWGSSWGKSGMCDIPYDYILNGNLANDFAVMRFNIDPPTA